MSSRSHTVGIWGLVAAAHLAEKVTQTHVHTVMHKG